MKITGVLAILTFLIACESEYHYERNREFPSKMWHNDSIAEFQFEIPSDTQQYNILLNIRNTLEYPFQNLYIRYYLEDTVGQELKTNLVNYQLFDSKTGRPLGDGGIGDMYDHRYTLLENYRFPQEGTYNVRLEQYMRRDSLPEIVSVGIRIEASTSK